MSIVLFPLKIILVTLDLFITIITFGWLGAIKKLFATSPMRSIPVDGDETHRVDAKYKGKKITPVEGVTTLHELALNSFKRYGSRPAMGIREYLGEHNKKQKKFGGVSYRTYEQLGDASKKFGASLRAAGLVSSPDKATLDQLTTSCTLAIYENTCPEWMIGALGAWSQGMSITTVYSTLGTDAVIDSVNDGKIRAILCNKTSVAWLLGKIKDMPTLKHIIYTDNMIAPGQKVDIPNAPKDVTVTSFDDFVSAGDAKAFPFSPPHPDTCAVIMYTSGSTGKPKGVVVTHKNVLATTSMVAEIVDENDVFPAFLPLAHIFELVAEVSCIGMGACLCYADPKTLTSTGAYPIGALEQYRPTLMVAVPKLWDLIKKGIEAKIAAGSPVKQYLCKTAIETREVALKFGFDTPLFKALVFKKFAAVTGGRLRLAVSGGGPLNADVQRFANVCFGCPVGQGYGLTETCAGLTLQDVKDDRCGIAGAPIPCVEVKMVSCPEINDKAGLPYLSSDRKDANGNPVFGRGEVWVRGANVGLGYYMMPEKTKEDFDEDGWFKTGDIGQFADDGSVQIVDRKKNLIKLKGGEYIAIENMEMCYNNSSFVDAATGGVCCYGDGDMDRPVAVIQLNANTVKNWMKQNGITDDISKVNESKALYDAVLADMVKLHKEAGLGRNEKLVAIAFLSDPWTPENGCLTAANKLQRRAVKEKHEKLFDVLIQKGIF
mmetsp:Transcript_2515/g.5541  ORF Transcript_2515/g.5541 Transcript_2515/m.5541 type:complete len:716 (-) Transcript_2515:55-2202(-)